MACHLLVAPLTGAGWMLWRLGKIAQGGSDGGRKEDGTSSPVTLTRDIRGPAPGQWLVVFPESLPDTARYKQCIRHNIAVSRVSRWA
jgi:hypothetical protein